MNKPRQSATTSTKQARWNSHRQDNVGGLHPAWVAFIRYCQELGYGEISQLKVQDGIPVMAEETKRKIKFVGATTLTVDRVIGGRIARKPGLAAFFYWPEKSR